MLGLLEKRRKLKRRKFSFPSISFKGKNSKKILIGLGIFLLVSLVGGYFALYRPAMKVKAQGQVLMAAAQEAKTAFKENDIDLVEQKLAVVDSEYAKLSDEAEALYWSRYIPFFGLYTRDFKNGIEAGRHLLDAGMLTVTAIKPHADLIGFKKGDDTSFTEKPAEERLQTAVLTLDKIVSDVDTIAVEVDAAREKIATIDENRYPKSFRGREIRPLIHTYKAQFEGIASLFVDSKPFIKSLPEILGAEEPKTYLVLFNNDKELRATGGFLTAFSIFKVDKGKFTVELSEDIYSLDDSIPSHPKAPREIATYHKNVNQFYIRDSNLSPDFPTSMDLFNELYDKSSQRTDYDGIISVDTNVLVGALEILGATQVRGITFTADNDPRCDCPQVIYTLLDEIDRPVSYIKADRKGILGDLLLALMQKALGFSPSQYWGQLSQMMMEELQQKHILMYMTNKDVQDAVVAMNFGGTINEYDGDYLHISDVNFAGAKSNLYVQHEVTSDAEISKDGTVTRTLELVYENPQPHSNCDLEEGGALGEGGLCINATLRNWVRIYVPKGSKLVSFDGSEMDVQEYDELGKTVFEGFLTVPPEGFTSATVSYTLPFKVENPKEYKLLIQKQPGTVGHDYTVKVNGSTIEEFDLTTDHEVVIE